MTGRIYENFAYCSLFSLKVGSPFSVLPYSTLPGVHIIILSTATYGKSC